MQTVSNINQPGCSTLVFTDNTKLTAFADCSCKLIIYCNRNQTYLLTAQYKLSTCQSGRTQTQPFVYLVETEYSAPLAVRVKDVRSSSPYIKDDSKTIVLSLLFVLLTMPMLFNKVSKAVNCNLVRFSSELSKGLFNYLSKPWQSKNKKKC